jgi:hypothetical protein
MYDACAVDGFESTQGLVNKVLEEERQYQTANILWASSPGNGHRSVSAYESRDVNQFASIPEQLHAL